MQLSIVCWWFPWDFRRQVSTNKIKLQGIGPTENGNVPGKLPKFALLYKKDPCLDSMHLVYKLGHHARTIIKPILVIGPQVYTVTKSRETCKVFINCVFYLISSSEMLGMMHGL